MILASSSLAGLYVSSTLLMLRLNLPPTARPLITQLLKGIEFDFFDRAFDFMYLAGAMITAIYLRVSQDWVKIEGLFLFNIFLMMMEVVEEEDHESP